MSLNKSLSAAPCDWYEVVCAMRRQCRAFTVGSISPFCEVSASWLDEHGVELRWNTGKVFRHLQILLVGSGWPLSVHFSGSTWVEPPRGPHDFKWWRAPEPAVVESSEEIEQAIDNWLPVTHRAIERLAAGG